MLWREKLKRFKLFHWLYNILHWKELRHNKEAYRRYGIHKPLFASVSSKDFPDKESKAWLDVGDSRLLAPAKPSFQSFPPQIREKIMEWSEKGYMILDGLISERDADRINTDIDELLRDGKIRFTNGNKLMFANRQSGFINAVTYLPGLKALLQFLLDKKVVPFQTINFIKGSEQKAHSDSIHMTTYPLGYLIAVWIALEDVNGENGPLFYYPGSHKLPFLMNSDYNEGATLLTLGKKEYTDYEDALQEMLEERKLRKQPFLAKKGDVLIWHANLVHGGAPILNEALTRRSMVIHYYADDVIKYHEITERPSLLKSD
ncbi:MAG: phytanoyl-CoA dioxygenase family protein [Chitinophagaceae bacterium]|nr:phytanoyl-CoA dioxygenase family protein [Chitinophagaceae bacterium]